jgi:hypothetical protein
VCRCGKQGFTRPHLRDVEVEPDQVTQRLRRVRNLVNMHDIHLCAAHLPGVCPSQVFPNPGNHGIFVNQGHIEEMVVGRVGSRAREGLYHLVESRQRIVANALMLGSEIREESSQLSVAHFGVSSRWGLGEASASPFGSCRCVGVGVDHSVPKVPEELGVRPIFGLLRSGGLLLRLGVGGRWKQQDRAVVVVGTVQHRVPSILPKLDGEFPEGVGAYRGDRRLHCLDVVNRQGRVGLRLDLHDIGLGLRLVLRLRLILVLRLGFAAFALALGLVAAAFTFAFAVGLALALSGGVVAFAFVVVVGGVQAITPSLDRVPARLGVNCADPNAFATFSL